MLVPYDFDQPQWGSATTYPDRPESINADYIVVHWGGSTNAIEGLDAEAKRLRAWQRYHIDGRGWRDIAYNYAFGDSGSIYRLRGLNPGGHTSTAKDLTPDGIPYNYASLGVVWIGGAGGVEPSPEGYAALAKIINATMLEPKGHRTVKQENGSSTACPGDSLLQWIDDEKWIGDDEEITMEALKMHLHMMIDAAWSSGNPNVQPENGAQYWHDLVEADPLSPEFRSLYRTAWKPIEE